MKPLTGVESKLSRASWMITYSDIVTLLLTFFILTMVILNEARRTLYVYIDTLLIEAEQELKRYTSDAEQDDVIFITRSTKGIKIVISSAKLFDSNRAEIKEGFKPTLEAIGRVLKESTVIRADALVSAGNYELAEIGALANRWSPLYKAIDRSGQMLKVEIRVEGHTDNQPIISGEYETNLELSTARALRVLSFLSNTSQIPERKFSALGYGEYRPIANNETEGGRALNRRVEIYLDAELINRDELTYQL
ncbi:MAG: OmpA family protein [Calditrichaeota bacterium]|nr:OmpA family protein [Calditrichota bacterium]